MKSELIDYLAAEHPPSDCRESTILKLRFYLGNNLRLLIGRRFLDLGCGSETSPDGYYPILCRLLHRHGVRVVGVDVASNQDEPFESHQLDLNDPHALDIFEAGSFDYVHHNALTYAGGGRTSPALHRMHTFAGDTRFALQLAMNASRLLRPQSGIYFQEWSAWCKGADGSLQPMESYSLRRKRK